METPGAKGLNVSMVVLRLWGSVEEFLQMNSREMVCIWLYMQQEENFSLLSQVNFQPPDTDVD